MKAKKRVSKSGDGAGKRRDRGRASSTAAPIAGQSRLSPGSLENARSAAERQAVIQRLQQQYGNVYVQRLLAHQDAASEADASATVQRAPIRDAVSGNVTGYEFRVGTELTAAFARLARRRAADGTINDADLRQLRQHAVRERGTVSDHERMFMAGLLDPANVTAVQSAALGPGSAVTFPWASISGARMSHVINLMREPLPASVTDPLLAALTAFMDLDIVAAIARLGEADTAASAAIVANAGSFRAQAARLLAFATENSLSTSLILQAMLAAASDSTAGDKVMAGTAYAIALQAGHPLASDLLGGSVKVDALIPRAFAALPGLTGGELAVYVTAAQAGGAKGDTMYLQTSLDVANLRDRSAVIHELQHAADDKAAPTTGTITATDPRYFPDKARLELTAYRSQAAYILSQMLAQDPAARVVSAAQVTADPHGVLFGALVLEAQANPARFRPILEPIFGAADPPFHRSPAGVAALLGLAPATIETALLTDITAAYGLAPGAVGITEGLSGESQIHWVDRI